jgi:hypothetical protein
MSTLTQEKPQYLKALELANEKRLARYELKRSVAEGKTRVVSIILDPPEVLRNGKRVNAGNRSKPVTVIDVLSWQRGWRDTRARRFLREHRLDVPNIPLIDLSPVTRRRIADALA